MEKTAKSSMKAARRVSDCRPDPPTPTYARPSRGRGVQLGGVQVGGSAWMCAGGQG